MEEYNPYFRGGKSVVRININNIFVFFYIGLVICMYIRDQSPFLDTWSGSCQSYYVWPILIQKAEHVPVKGWVLSVYFLVYRSMYLLGSACHLPNVTQRLLLFSNAWNFICLWFTLAYRFFTLIGISWRWKAVCVRNSACYSSEIPGLLILVILTIWVHLCLKLISSLLP